MVNTIYNKLETRFMMWFGALVTFISLYGNLASPVFSLYECLYFMVLLTYMTVILNDYFKHKMYPLGTTAFFDGLD